MPQRHGPKVYEEIREQSGSKEKAARIANTPPSTAGRRGGKAPDYDDMTREELYQKARRIGIEGRSSMNKGELIRALRRGN